MKRKVGIIKKSVLGMEGGKYGNIMFKTAVASCFKKKHPEWKELNGIDGWISTVAKNGEATIVVS